MDPITTTIGGGLIAYASKDLISKLLGPTAEYVGGEIKSLVEKCNLNLEDIFVRAGRKAGQNLEDGSQVNPRVIKGIISDGSFCDDSILKEYYAGVLASSRSKVVGDDIGVSLLAVLKAASVYQIKLHYLFYHQVYKHYSGEPVHLGSHTERKKRKVFLPFSMIIPAFGEFPVEAFDSILVHAINGLVTAELVGPNWQYGNPESLEKFIDAAPESGLVLEPTLGGIELFMWANGKSRISPTIFLGSDTIDPEFDFPILGTSLPAVK